MFISSVLDHEREGKLLGGPAISLSFARVLFDLFVWLAADLGVRVDSVGRVSHWA